MEKVRDPRAIRSRARIVAATRELLLASGPGSVTFGAVAERAGVGRATVYRHWVDVDELLDEVMDEFSLPYFRAPTEPLDQWLYGELRRLADELLDPAVVRMTTLLVQRGAADETKTSRRERLFSVLERRLGEALHLPGLASGDTPPHTDEIAATLIGPLLYLSFGRGSRVTDEFIHRLIAGCLRPVTAPSSASGR